MPSEGGKAVQITKAGRGYAIESFDGKMLYYIKSGRYDFGGGPMWKVPPEGGEETLVSHAEIGFLGWVLRPDSVLFYDQGIVDNEYRIIFFSFQTGQITPFYQEKTPNGRTYLAISPDGEWLAYAESPPQESDLMLVENFR